MTKNNNLDH